MRAVKTIFVKIFISLFVLIGKTIYFPFSLFEKKVDIENILDRDAKILIIKIWTIGEVAMVTPIFRELKRNYPHIDIGVLVGRDSSDILKNNPHIDEVIDVDERIFLNFNPPEISGLIRRLRSKRFDIAIVLHHSVLFNIFTWLIGAKVRVGFDRMGEGFLNTIKVKPLPERHKVDEYLSMAEALGAKVRDNSLEIYPTIEDEKFVEDFLERNDVSEKDTLVGIMPTGGKNLASKKAGASLERKAWPLDYYIELSKLLVEGLKAKVIIFGGRDEIEKAMVIKSRIKENLVDAVDKMNLRQLNALAQKCSLIATNDSGPMHIVGISGNPLIVIFGPTDPSLCGPISKNSYIINRNLGCRPCFRGDIFPNIVRRCDKNVTCMQLIRPDEIYDLIEQRFQGKEIIK